MRSTHHWKRQMMATICDPSRNRQQNPWELQQLWLALGLVTWETSPLRTFSSEDRRDQRSGPLQS